MVAPPPHRAMPAASSAVSVSARAMAPKSSAWLPATDMTSNPAARRIGATVGEVRIASRALAAGSPRSDSGHSSWPNSRSAEASSAPTPENMVAGSARRGATSPTALSVSDIMCRSVRMV